MPQDGTNCIKIDEKVQARIFKNMLLQMFHNKSLGKILNWMVFIFEYK